jgi:DNA segregation ATPase FtsK/SpoIIIE-like protein
MNTKRNHIINVILTSNMDILQEAYKMPTLSLLNDYKKSYKPSKAKIRKTIDKIKDTFESFGVVLEGGEASVGSNVTQYEFAPSKD